MTQTLNSEVSSHSLDKNLITNLVAFGIALVGLFSPVFGDIILMTGLFALSGGITNWLAIYMLFERVPYLYGSGVIPNRFEDFKSGIKELMIQEFFTSHRIEHFFQEGGHLLIENMKNDVDLNKVFDQLVETIEQSKLGDTLKMVGGRAMLEPLRQPMTEKFEAIMTELATEQADKAIDGQKIISQLEQVIDSRLEELTPQKVKELVQQMIRHHLGWLVVWGGVFGGLIGFVISLINAMA